MQFLMLVRGKLNKKQLPIKPQRTPCRIACITFTIQAEHLASESLLFYQPSPKRFSYSYSDIQDVNRSLLSNIDTLL